MEPLTGEKALELLREVVAEFGADYVYPVNYDPAVSRGCDYIRDGQPSCIAAQVAYRFGIPIETIAEWDTQVEGGLRADVALSGHATHDAAYLLRVAQSHQDAEKPWGDTLSAAECWFAGGKA